MLTFTLLTMVLTAQQATGDKTEESTMSNAQDYIASFRRGEDFTPPATGVIVDGKPDAAALALLGQELAVASPSVRENIVALLVDMGLQTDPLTPQGAEVLRDRQIITLLTEAGLATPDLGREAAMEALRILVTQPDLAHFGDAFTDALETAPTEEAFLLVAKAKPQPARVVVERLARTPAWEGVEAARIALAAFGARAIEDEFLAAAKRATDGETLARALNPLALMGTSRSLRVIAEHLRTPLTIHIPGAFEKSVRLDVLEALLYNFPDQPVLYPNNIVSDEDYLAAELFCTETLGVEYRRPRPPFLTYRGYPIPLEP